MMEIETRSMTMIVTAKMLSAKMGVEGEAAFRESLLLFERCSSNSSIALRSFVRMPDLLLLEKDELSGV